MTVMIDWLTATIQTPPQLCTGYNSGYKILIDPNGQIMREESSLHSVREETPSYSRSFSVSTPRRDILRISGNPSKLLQGHNLFGSDDISGCYVESGDFIHRRADLFPSPESYETLQYSKPQYSRIDITRSFRFSDPKDVPIYIREIVGTARTRSGRATLYGSETAYFQKGTRRWAMKIYDKHTEYEKRLDNDADTRDPRTKQLLEWSEGIVRFELVLRGQELTSINHSLKHGKVVDLNEIFDDYFNRIQFNENLLMKKINPALESELKSNLKIIISMWQDRKDLRAFYSKPTFYRHRQAVLAATGIDISSPPDDSVLEMFRKADAKKEISSKLDPSGWDPEPIESYFVKPRESLKKAYKLP